MKKLISLSLTCLLSFILLSWGSLGHQSVGLIAERHLSPSAKAAVEYYLGTQGLAEVSTWADDVRNQSQYRHTGAWHYLNLPLGLSFQQFQGKVTGLSEDNVYKALLQCKQDLANPGKSKQEKAEALKFIVHFVGDLHQPMHVSRAEDKGGNTIQVNFDGRGTNLHALWDSKLLDHQGLDVKGLADKSARASAAQIKQWQGDPVTTWLWESYQISTRLYAEVEQMNKRTLTEEYYQKHIPIIEERIERAGVRLAGVLNEVFKSTSLPKPTPPTTSTNTNSTTVKTVAITEVSNHMGEDVQVCALLYGYKEFSGMTLLNLGADFPNQLLTVVLKGEANKGYAEFKGKAVCVTGKLVDYKGKAEIIVTDPNRIKISK